MNPKLIVALDFSSEKEVLDLIRLIKPESCALKIGSELFTLLGPSFVAKLIEQDYRIFLDLKFHDIPNTVAKACTVAAELGVWMLNVHASGGMNMLEAARKAIHSFGAARPLLIAVTVLTSFVEADLKQIGVDKPIEPQVINLAKLTYEAGLDGVVCSAHEVPAIKSVCSASFITVTPGIRLKQDLTHDQARIMSPEQALRWGSDYLVMGRSITHAENPHEIIQTINQL